MPSRGPSRVLQAIAYNSELARRFVGDVHYDAFAADERTIYAVTRCLEIVSEASRRLPEDLKSRHPAVPWEQIAGAGNVYRHDYEDVLPRILWNTVVNHLDALEAAIHSEIKQSKE